MDLPKKQIELKWLNDGKAAAKQSLVIKSVWNPACYFLAQIEAMGSAGVNTEGDSGSSQVAGACEAPGGGGGGSTSGQGTMLHFLSRLRRHASLEGASPYFTIKKWKLDSSNRAASLDLRGEELAEHVIKFIDEN